MRTKIYEVYGCVDDAKIFIGSSDILQIAVVTANNHLGSARYMSVLIYEIVKEDDEIISRDIIQQLSINNRGYSS